MLRNNKTELSKQYAFITILAISMEKLNADIDKTIKAEIDKAGDSNLVTKYKEDEFFYARGPLGLVKGTNLVIDNECVGDIIENDKVQLDVYKETRDAEGKKTSFSIFAVYTMTVKLSELLKDFEPKEVSLEEFMGSRFGYNPRIENNMRIIGKEVKQ